VPREISSIPTALGTRFGRTEESPIVGPEHSGIDRPREILILPVHRPHHAKPETVVIPSTPKQPPAAPARSPVLSLSTVRFRIKEKPELMVGYKTGDIKHIKNVSIWVNPENTDMLMDRFIGKSVSAQIRYLGSNKDDDGNVIEDTIAEALRTAVGARGRVRVGTVLVTESGSLRATHRVHRVFHVAIVESAPGATMRARKENLVPCIGALLDRAERVNKSIWKIIFKIKAHESILIPMMGTGEGGLLVEDVAETVIRAAIDHLLGEQLPTLKEVYFLAYTERDKEACDHVLEQYCEDGILVRFDEKS